ncbi:hypothetical protein Tc00.1047053507041.90 [Trypanosoma cruzi]|uniref:Uncharacterized protein n=1 Tax=Trypanosoma cruzi (strain CL Brener) TaxID=353153 RepID=Q4DBJ2_TRYCC|nr:hypothetical protein Tc00.1047053507041.90 [Trypanosoma cruzi]EAN89898.1 hypothetical protein Tc00.1047053507041.90 [Trypanosoma cruzi]|eukprot:XP_811749.1 hypothetical protein [Trypanosoma cruzi strain CL Brener]
MLFFIAVIPIVCLPSGYLWCMGRHQAKVERRAAIEDGMRTQGMAEPHGATGGRLRAQHLMACNSGHPQDNATSPTRPREQQEGMHGGCGQFAAAENFGYPQEHAAVQQQDGEEPYEGCYHPACHGGTCIAVGDEYVGSILVGAGNEEVKQVDENPSHGGLAAHS